MFSSKAPSEEPTMTDPDDKPDPPPQSSAEPDPPPYDLDQTAENPPVEELERLDVGVSEPSVEEEGGAEKGSSARGVEDGDGDGDGKSEGGSDGDKDEDGDSQSDDEKKEESRRVNKYPVRPEAEDCSYYIKTGTCKFGSNCKFNHPVRRKNQVCRE